MNSNSPNLIPEIMQPNWEGISIEEIPVKFGQILKFKKDDTEMTAIVVDFNKDKDDLSIGLCFIKNNKIFGRQIPNGMINTSCIDLLDLSYIKINELNKFKVLKILKLDKSKIGIGSISHVANLKELKRDFNRGIEQRKKEQTQCDKGLTDLNPVRECYFDIEKITSHNTSSYGTTQF